MYIPGLEASKSITPVDGFKDKPVVEEKAPPVAVIVGVGSLL